MRIYQLGKKFDLVLIQAIEKYGLRMLEMSIGLIYLWFGILKFFPGLSPAEQLAEDTLSVIFMHYVDGKILLYILAAWEVVIGVFLLFGVRSKWIIKLLLLHMAGTLIPLIIFPEIVFDKPPFGFSIVGQYIMKNVVIIAAILVLYTKTMVSRPKAI